MKDKSHKTVSTDHNRWRERRAQAESNRGPSTHQSNALPLGQTGSRYCASLPSKSSYRLVSVCLVVVSRRAACTRVVKARNASHVALPIRWVIAFNALRPRRATSIRNWGLVAKCVGSSHTRPTIAADCSGRTVSDNTSLSSVQTRPGLSPVSKTSIGSVQFRLGQSISNQ